LIVFFQNFAKLHVIIKQFASFNICLKIVNSGQNCYISTLKTIQK